jgi:hypothetical protein
MPERLRPAVLGRVLRLIAEEPDPDRRERLGWATVNLAGLYLPRATIDLTWEDSAMPIPSLTSEIYEEAVAETSVKAAAALLRIRFGDDERIDALASSLAQLDLDECMARIEKAGSLDELA